MVSEKALTVRELYFLGIEKLTEASIENPKTDARAILENLLNIEFGNLILRYNDICESEIARKYLEKINARSENKPLAYIINHKEFYSLSFFIKEGVLIPRPETENLVTAVLNLRKKPQSGLKIADVCSGSGCIGITLAKNLPDSEVYLFDVSDIALEVALINKNKLNTYNVNVLKKDILNEGLDGYFDVIVSNPPYIPSREMDDLMPDVALYEPKIALTDNNDGLTFYKRLAYLAKNHLNDGGILAFEVSINRHIDVKRIVNEFFPENEVEVIKDYFGIERIVLLKR